MKKLTYAEKLACMEIEYFICKIFEDALINTTEQQESENNA